MKSKIKLENLKILFQKTTESPQHGFAVEARKYGFDKEVVYL